MFGRTPRTLRKPIPSPRSRLECERLESRALPATGITAWVDASSNVLYVYGTLGNDYIQVKFANQAIQVLDKTRNVVVGIDVTTNGVTSPVSSVPAAPVPYVIVSTSAGTNIVNVFEVT